MSSSHSSSSLRSTSSSEDEVENFDLLIEKLRLSRKKEARHSEEKVTRLACLLEKQQNEIEDLRRTVKLLKSQEFQKKAKYEETSSAASLTSSEDDEESSESDFYDEGIDSAPNTSQLEPSHPLLIDLVLETIMEHLPLKSLLVARLVCKKWNRFAHHHLQELCDPVVLEVHQPWKPSRGHKLSKFLDTVKSSIEDCPFTKYVLRSFTNVHELDKFFRKFGPSVRSLDLNFNLEFDDNAGFRRILFEYTPCLDSLRVECCKMLESSHFWEYSEYEQGSSKLHHLKTLYIGNIREGVTLSSNWIKELLTMSPNLEKIILQVHFKDNGHAFIQAVLDALLQSKNVHRIKSIFISSLTEAHLHTLIQLANKGLNLRAFKFQDICLQTTPDDRISPETIHNFLWTQCEGLETLRIEQRSNRVRGFTFPSMKALKHLTMISDDELNVGCVNYSKTFPSLESLTLRGYGVFSISNYFSEAENKRFAGAKLKKLSLPSGIRNEGFPRLLARIFPEVKDLEIRGASNGFLRSIWHAWPRLEKLKMVVSHYDGPLDSGITGIDQDECIRIQNDMEFSEYADVDMEDIQDGPSLAEIRTLRELEIECRSIWIPCNIITDISGFFAFSRMPNLRSFKFTEIGVPERFDFSDKCIEFLHEELPATDITFKIMDDHGRWQLELEEIEANANMYETEPQLEDHNKDKVYSYEKQCQKID